MTDIENREKNDFENEDADDLLSRDPEEASRALERITQIFAEANERDNLPERDPENPDMATLDAQGLSELKEVIAELHPADVAYVLEALPQDERLAVWNEVRHDQEGDVLIEVGDGVRESLIDSMDHEDLVDAVEGLDTDEIADLVAGVTKLDKIQFHNKEEEQTENMRKMFFAMAKDIRVMMIKLADRLHNMRSLMYLSEEKQQVIAKETLDIFAPIAGRLGISSVKSELEDLCLKYLDRKAYDEIAQGIAMKKAERETIVENFIFQLKDKLKESNLVNFDVYWRTKHFYSIYKKMKKQNKTLEQVYDLTAVRVIVETIKDCYAVLGSIHDKWKPMPGRFKDYIAVPKRNMYQSLHTTVFLDYQSHRYPIEVQIRTYEMHKIAEYGVAAHWK